MLRRLGDPILLVVALLAAWQALHWLAGEVTLASPAEALARLAQLLVQAGFWGNIDDTLRAFAASVVISVLGGVLLGAALGLSRLAGQVMEPILMAVYALPKVTLYPLVLLVFGLGLSAKIAFGVMHGMLPISIMTMNAILQIRPVYLRSARSLRLGRAATLWWVVRPAIGPELLAGIRVGVPLCLLGVLIGEMFASSRGLGFLAMRAMEQNDAPTLMAIAVLLAVLAIAVNAAFSLRRRGAAKT